MQGMMPLLTAWPWVGIMLTIWKHRLWSMLKVTYLEDTNPPYIMPTILPYQ